MKTPGLRACLVALVGVFGLTATAGAQVTFTITGTANDNSLGYIKDSSYTFAFTTGSSFAVTATSVFNATRNLWSEEETTDGQLWASIGGSGLSGSYARPNSGSSDPSSTIKVDSTDALLIGAGNSRFSVAASFSRRLRHPCCTAQNTAAA